MAHLLAVVVLAGLVPSLQAKAACVSLGEDGRSCAEQTGKSALLQFQRTMAETAVDPSNKDADGSEADEDKDVAEDEDEEEDDSNMEQEDVLKDETTDAFPAGMLDDDPMDLAEEASNYSAAPISCAAETLIRTEMAKIASSLDASLIRGVFHDATDADNLVVKNDEGKWKLVPSDEEHYGGVDGCLYSPLSEGKKGTPEPSHNRNIDTSFKPLQKLCQSLCQHADLKGTALCSKLNNCFVDISVLGALTAIENAGGPRIPMTWGRVKGPCDDIIVTPFTKHLGADALKKLYSTKPALNFAPSLTGIDNVGQFRKAFEHLGFNAEEQTALMGAHTFGQLEVCAGGMGGIEHGNFCTNKDLLDPPLTKDNLTPDSKPKKDAGTCVPKEGVVNNCWLKAGGQLKPVWWHPKKSGRAVDFGDGGFWDHTPEKFDNDYFKVFQSEDYSGKDTCCGKVKKGWCHRSASPVRITKRARKGRALKWKPVKAGICSLNWCRSDRNGQTHMKSVKAWHEPDPSFVKKPYHHGPLKRLIRLAGDWALLGREDTKAAVDKFADSEAAFHDAFSAAFAKVINKGYEHNGALQACTP